MKRNKLRRVTATALLLSFALPQCAQAAAVRFARHCLRALPA